MIFLIAHRQSRRWLLSRLWYNVHSVALCLGTLSTLVSWGQPIYLFLQTHTFIHIQSISFDPFFEEHIYINICHQFSYAFALAILWFIVITCITIFLFIKSRHIFISNLSDTWHCGICVVLIAFFGVIAVICGFLLADYPDLFGSVVGALLWLCVTLVLIVLFLHLVSHLHYAIYLW